MVRPLKNLAEVAVIGGGIAGLSAARHAARLGRLVTLFEDTGLYGGQLATVGHVDGLMVPGRPSGQDLAIPLLEEARGVRVRVVEAGIVRLSSGNVVTLIDENSEEHHPATVIVASGARLRKLGVPGEEKLQGRGVSQCATCDGGFFRKQHVVVVGGGDAAAHEALELAKLCAQVTIVSRGPTRAKADYVDKLEAAENVRFVWGREAIAILGEDGVEGVRLRHVVSGETIELPCAGVFPFIGVVPNGRFLPPDLVNAAGLISTGSELASSDPRIFAAGAIRAGYGGNVLQAMAEGVTAATSAARVLATIGGGS